MNIDLLNKMETGRVSVWFGIWFVLDFLFLYCGNNVPGFRFMEWAMNGILYIIMWSLFVRHIYWCEANDRKWS